jgi:aminoglycoside/choline kinase family phosphotransferase
MTAAREEALAALLAKTGWEGAARAPLAGDASTRRYERLTQGARTAILMDAPRSAESGPCPPEADEQTRLKLGWNATSRLAASRVEAFVAVGAYLDRLGLSPPAIYGLDAAAGFALMEDLGDALFAQVIPHGAPEEQLYARAGEALAVAQSSAPPAILDGPAGPWPLLAFDALALRVNANLFVEWLPQATDVRFSDRDLAVFEAIRESLIAQAMTYPQVLTIRDYHAENLLWLPDRPGVKAVGLLDFQDAVLGFRGWDLSMLLHDARRDLGPGAAASAMAAYLAASGADEAAVRAELSVLGALNVMRILGIFCRLTKRDQKPRYLTFMPRMWGHFANVLTHRDLAELAALMHRVAGPQLEGAR